jgi:DNA-binding CsgD family transcriptional regulator
VTERPAPGLGIPVTPRCRGVSARQEEVLLLIGDGFGLGEIATRLGVSEWTVRTHRDEGRRRLQARTTTQAVAIIVRLGAASR